MTPRTWKPSISCSWAVTVAYSALTDINLLREVALLIPCTTLLEIFLGFLQYFPGSSSCGTSMPRAKYSCSLGRMKTRTLSLYHRGRDRRTPMRRLCCLLKFLLSVRSDLLTTSSIYASLFITPSICLTVMSSTQGVLFVAVCSFQYSSSSFFWVLVFRRARWYLNRSAFVISFYCDCPYDFSSNFSLRTTSSRDRYWCPVHQGRRVLWIEWVAPSTKRGLTDFSSYPDSQHSVFAHNSCAIAARVVDSCLWLRTFTSSLAILVSVTYRFRRNRTIVEYNFMGTSW